MRMASALALVLSFAATEASAQVREPLPRFAIDLHGAWVGLPTAEGWVPVVDDPLTQLPGRGWGLTGGANIYLVKLGFMTLGAGAHVATGRGSASMTTKSGSGATETSITTPVVTTQITSLLPYLSMNFGHRLGWSYLSVGYGRTKVSSEIAASEEGPGSVVPEAWNPALNFGGGAKWFMKPHLGVSFDVRFTKLSSRGATDTLPSAKRTQMVTLSVGISIR